MFNELDLASTTSQNLVDAILALKGSETPLLIRAADQRKDLAFWQHFLKNACGLRHDQRHYQADESLAYAAWWEISYQPEKASSYTYSKTAQPFHNDNAWFSDPAEINFFAMEKQAISGGEQIIYPVSRLIADLDAFDKTLLHDLCSIQVTIKKGGDDFKNVTTIITGDSDKQVFWNFYRTDKNTPAIDSMCNAFFKFLASKENSSSTFKMRCHSGDCVAFNDQKVLHARTAFEASAPRERILYQSMWHLP